MALAAAKQAALVSPAYRILLNEHKLHPDAINHATDIATLPVLDKANTFGRFGIQDLARPFRTEDLADVLTSSGRCDTTFGFRLTGRRQYERSWFDIDLGLQDAFKVDEHPTLLVNCLPMGVVFRSRAVTVANVSVREDMACAVLRHIGQGFAQTLLCSDPLFIRRILDKACSSGVDWKALNTSVIIGEEVLAETQRDYIAAKMAMDPDTEQHRLIASSFGVGELGLNLLFETRECIRLRRAMRVHPEVAQIFSYAANRRALPSIFCFNPSRCYVEILNPNSDGFGELCLTMLDRQAIIPLPRYTTGDIAKLVSRKDIALAASHARSDPPWLPVVAVAGRIADQPDGVPSVEDIKNLIYSDHTVADQLSGAFRIINNEIGKASLVVQANAALTGEGAELRHRLERLIDDACSTHLQVEVVNPESFPWRPILDYERKFAYRAAG
jgi:phenylacetate-CoA ligase